MPLCCFDWLTPQPVSLAWCLAPTCWTQLNRLLCFFWAERESAPHLNNTMAAVLALAIDHPN
jgi:hypothetical protein